MTNTKNNDQYTLGYTQGPSDIHIHTRGVLLYYAKSPPLQPTASFNTQSPFINLYSSTTKNILITEIILYYQIEHINNNTWCALARNTSVNMHIHARLLSTQALWQAIVTFNKKNPLINQYSSIMSTSITADVLDDKYQWQWSICPGLYSKSKQYTYTYKKSIVTKSAQSTNSYYFQ